MACVETRRGRKCLGRVDYFESADLPHGVLPTKKAVIEVMLYLLHPRCAGQSQRSRSNAADMLTSALSLVFGVKKFHQYLYGRNFQLMTDHKPLTMIFGSKTGVPPIAAARLQRWALLLSAYSYNIIYKQGVNHSNVDGLSRLPLSEVKPSAKHRFYGMSA